MPVWDLARKLVVVIVLAACATPNPQPADSPLPTSQPKAFVSVLPTPDSDAATVVGKLVNLTDNTPLPGLTVFLERTPQAQNAPPLIYAPPNDQPRTVTSTAGDFVISEVPDGEYVVVVFLPPVDIEVLLDRQSKEQPLFVSVKAGDVVDIGTFSLRR